MMLKLHRFACCWILGASHASEGRRAEHPLCRALTSGEQQRPIRFPSAYVCYGEGGGDASICAPRAAETMGATTAPKAGMHNMYKGHGQATWWVYEDRRKHISRRPGDLTPEIWVDCPGYYAFRGVGFDVGDSAGVSLAQFPEGKLKQMREFEGPVEESSEDLPLPARRASRSLRSSHKTTAIVEEGARGISTLSRGGSASRIESGQNVKRKLDQQRNSFVYAPNDICQEFWMLWPAVHEKAISDGTFLIFDVFPSIGNLFLAVQDLLQFVRLLELGLIITWDRFPGFREAFDPAEINWGLDPVPFRQKLTEIIGGVNPFGFHAMEFNDYAMVLSDPQLELLASNLGLADTSHEALTTYFRGQLPKRFASFMNDFMRAPMSKYPALTTHPCAWNMLLRRSPAIMAGLKEHSPWGMVMGDAGLHHHPTEYVAWHIRTNEGETETSYDASIHHHVLSEPATVVCPAFLAAMDDVVDATQNCAVPHAFGNSDSMVYISSNSKAMSSECTVEAAAHGLMTGHIDLGLSSGDAHTWFSTNPSLTALNAFLDYLFLMDSAAIVRTSSSFSGTVTKIKAMDCHQMVYDMLPGRLLYLCLPGDCSVGP